MKTLNPTSPTKPLSLRANFSWTFVGNVVYAASQWGMLIVLARLGTPEMVGLFALGLAVTTPTIMFSNLALRAVQATDSKRDFTFGDYLGLRIITTILAMIVISVIALAAYTEEATIVIILIGVAKAFEALSDVIFGFLQQQERMDRIAQSMMIKGPVSLIAMGLGVLLTNTVAGGVAGMIIVWATLFAFYDMRSARLLVTSIEHLRPHLSIPKLRQLVWLALPLGFVMMLTSLNSSIPRLFVERYLGEEQLGIFAAMAYIIIAGNTIMSALGQSATARLATYYAHHQFLDYYTLALKLSLVAIIIGVASVLLSVQFGEYLLRILYGAMYAEYADVFVYIMLGGAITYIVFVVNYVIFAARVFWLSLFSSIMIVMVTFATCLWLIPGGDLMSVAITVIIISGFSLLAKGAELTWIYLYRFKRLATELRES